MKRRLRVSIAFAVAVTFALLPQCHMLVQESGSNDSNNEQSDADDGDDDEDEESGYDSGPVRLEYDHDLSVEYGNYTMNLDITGSIDVEHYQNAIGRIWCPNSGSCDPYCDGVVFRLQGEETIPIVGSIAFGVGEESGCSINFSADCDVSIEGLRHYVPNAANCSDEVFNLKLSETWYRNIEAQASCWNPDPDTAEALEESFRASVESMPEHSPEQYEEFTLQYQLCNGQIIEQPFEGDGGSGTYRWTFYLWDQGPFVYTPGHPLRYDDELCPDGQVLCSDFSGSIGPALESIEVYVDPPGWYDYPYSSPP